MSLSTKMKEIERYGTKLNNKQDHKSEILFLYTCEYNNVENKFYYLLYFLNRTNIGKHDGWRSLYWSYTELAQIFIKC